MIHCCRRSLTLHLRNKSLHNSNITQNIHRSSVLFQDHDLEHRNLQEDQTTKYKILQSETARRPIISNTKIYNNINLSLNVFRDLGEKYNFMKLSPPVINIDVHQVSGTFWLKFATQTNDKLDLMEAWHLLGTTPATCDSDQQQLENIQENIVSKLTENLTEYSYQQLSEIVTNLRILYAKPTDLTTFTKILDDNLINKMQAILNQESPSEEEIDQCLKIAFLWERTVMESHQYQLPSEKIYGKFIRHAKLAGDHNSAMLHLLFQKHLDRLTPQQLLFGLFLCSIKKRYPGCYPKFSKGQGFPIPDALYEKLVQVIPQYSNMEIGLLCNCLHQSHLLLELKHSAVRQAALQTLVNYDEKHISRDRFIIACIAKFLRRRGSENHKYVIKTMEKYKKHLSSIGTFSNIRLLQFILQGKPSQTESREFIRELCNNLGGQLNTVRLKDLELLAYGLYFLNHKDVNVEMRGKIADAVHKCDWADVKSGRSFVYLTMILAKMGQYEIESINQIMDAANKSKIGNLETEEGLARSVQFMFDLNIPFVRNVTTKHIIKHIHSSRYYVTNTLFCLLELDGIRQIRGLDWVKLDKKIKRKLIKHFHGLPQHEFHAFSSDYENNGNISAETFADHVKGFVHRDLVNIMKSEDKVWAGHTYQHSTSSVFILRKCDSGKFLPFPDDFKAFDVDQIYKADEEGVSQIAVIVPKKGEVDYHGNMFGPLETTVNQLKILGYTPVLVFWVDYFRAVKQKKNLNYLRGLLNIKYNNVNHKKVNK